MSPSIAAVIVVVLTNLLTLLLPVINIHIEGSALTQWVTTGVDIAGGVVIWLHSRYQTGQIVGHANVTLFGGVKK